MYFPFTSCVKELGTLRIISFIQLEINFTSLFITYRVNIFVTPQKIDHLMVLSFVVKSLVILAWQKPDLGWYDLRGLIATKISFIYKKENWISESKKPPDVFCKKKVFLKMCKFHRKTAEFESLFNKPWGLQLYPKRYSNTCSPVKF